MGDRWTLEVECARCGFVEDDVPFAPTSGIVEWTCPKCGHIENLEELTGISYEDASSAEQMALLARNMGL